MRIGWIGLASLASSGPSAATAWRAASCSRGSQDSSQASPGGPGRPGGRVGQGGEERAEVTGVAGRQRGMRRDLPRRVGDMNHGWFSLRIILVTERPITEPEVQRRAHHDDQVRLPERGRPGPGDQQLMTPGQDAAALAVGDDRQPQFLGRGPGGLLRAAHPHVRAEHQHRALGRRDQARDGRGRLRVARPGVS